LTAKIIWGNLEKNFPEVIGPVNPNNDKIQQIFGDQGGY
jgi:acyloxyacyl hydrolase